MTDPHDTHTTEEFEQSLVEHDEWFRHSADEPHHQEAHGETKSQVILLFLLGTVVFVFGTGFVVLKFFEAETRKLKATMDEAATSREEYLDANERWERELTSYGWASAIDGSVHIPLELATREVLGEYKSRAGAND